MLFLDVDHILVLEKEGNVRLVSSGVLQPSPVLSLPAVNKNERGLLGIEKIGENVFLYVTESDGGRKIQSIQIRHKWIFFNKSEVASGSSCTNLELITKEEN